MTTVSSALPAQVHLTAYRGDTFSQQFRLLTDGQPLDLNGMQITATARASTGERIDLPVNVIGNIAEGTIALSQPPDGLPADLYHYDIQALTQAGTVTTWIRGSLRVSDDITIP